MPGRHLSDDERELLNLWNNPPPNLARPFLGSIAVSGGLRGIDALLVPFRFPITALCGKNGVGKSTILALAALAHHSPPGWNIPNWLYQPRSRSVDRSYYTFGDFFVRAVSDQSFDGISVSWTYRSSSPVEPVTFTKAPSRWGRYANRPEREVAFCPLGRLLPAHEISGVRSAFAQHPQQFDSYELSQQALEQLSYIMGRVYSLAEIRETKRHTLQRVRAGGDFTGFNMGGGESWVVNLLHTLHGLPRGSLLVVEDIEAGLHPQAQVRLATVLVKLCLTRQMQIVCSTHSEPFLDALPRQARILLRNPGEDHEAFESPSTRFALYEMTGQIQPELTIYCEDLFARLLVEEALPHDVKVRCSVREIGDWATVIRQGVSHLRSGYEMRALCVLDGDCSVTELKNRIAIESGSHDEHRPEWLVLPGELAPEKWIAEQLIVPDYRNRFAVQFDCSIARSNELIEAVHAELDHHNLGHRLQQMTGMDSQDCIRRTMRSVAPVHPQLDALREMIRQSLG